MKGWQAEDGTLAVTIWNPTAHERTVNITCAATGRVTQITVPAEMATAAEI